MYLTPSQAQTVLKAFQDRGYWVPKPESKPFNLALFGVRYGSKPGKWDDYLGALYYDGNGRLQVEVWAGTTEPGREGTAGDLNDNGVARLIPGRYSRCWKIGLHKGRPALIQSGSGVFKVWRDAKVDGAYTEGKVFTDVQGLNMHRPYKDGLTLVGDASWGCQVFFSTEDQGRGMELAHAQKANGFGDYFSYVLFTEDQLDLHEVIK